MTREEGLSSSLQNTLLECVWGTPACVYLPECVLVCLGGTSA